MHGSKKPIKSYLIVTLLCLFISGIFAQINEYDQPWQDTNIAIIIDFYSGNEVNWSELKKDQQLTAIIHKASQGLKFDGKYIERRDSALKYGYLWGSYHLGVAGDPIEQADHYLNIVGTNSHELLALDLESEDSTKHMNLRNAVLFINRIYEKTNRYPMVYCNRNMLDLINRQYGRESIFSLCPLWYARFRKDIPEFEMKVWDSYTLWQFSSEINCKKSGQCLYNIPGTRYDMDVNVYHGSKAELRTRWPF